MREVNFSEVIKAVRAFDEASETFLDSIEKNFGEVPQELMDCCYKALSLTAELMALEGMDREEVEMEIFEGR